MKENKAVRGELKRLPLNLLLCIKKAFLNIIQRDFKNCTHYTKNVRSSLKANVRFDCILHAQIIG